MKVVHSWIADFNIGDSKSAVSLCADSGAILDDIYPYVWQGDAVCSKWLSAYETFVKQQDVTGEAFTAGKVRHLEILKDDAYLTIPVTENYRLRGRRMTDAALVTMSLHKASSGWRITGWSWGKR